MFKYIVVLMEGHPLFSQIIPKVEKKIPIPLHYFIQQHLPAFSFGLFPRKKLLRNLTAGKWVAYKEA